MLPDYDDIRELIDRPPDWFDKYGVPRYKPFSPDMLGIYDDFALLVLIQCQSCTQFMKVGSGWSHYDQYRYFRMGDDLPEPWTLRDLAEGYHYGDPPRHGCPGAGETMGCIEIKIQEAWTRDRKKREWVRDAGVEKIDIYPDWMKD